MNRHIAIVEDDDTIRTLLAENLRRAGFTVSAFFSAEQLERQLDQNFHLLLLDIMLPGKSGIALLETLKKRGLDLPVIFITASEQESHTDAAFAAGAIDYIVKPFNLKHLLQKIENLLNRIKAPAAEGAVLIGEGRFYPSLQLVRRGQKEYKLTPSETAALEYFLRNPNRIISRDELKQNLRPGKGGLRNMDNHILKFRRLFEQEPKKPRHFITIPRKGYALRLT
ncbi:MAG: response regulator transcription factor [Turneriella sp.]|nr:response regulator transcription factor [Leptospiraceae bacterium]MCX7632531.1 response regulator transcription factor [Turneriella sp.]